MVLDRGVQRAVHTLQVVRVDVLGVDLRQVQVAGAAQPEEGCRPVQHEDAARPQVDPPGSHVGAAEDERELVGED